MRSNLKVFTGLLAAAGLTLLSCSRSDVLTGVGEDVISDMDPGLTYSDRGFVMIDLGAADADSAFSLPASPSDTFSTRFDGHIYIGISGRGDTLAAHMQYQVTAFDTAGARYTKNDTLKEAYLYFRADDRLGASPPIPVLICDTLVGLMPVNRNDKRIYIPMPDPEEEDGGHATVFEKVGDLILSAGTDGTVDSLELPKDIANMIFNVRTRAAQDTAYAFAFSIVDYLGEARSIQNPYVVLTVIAAASAGEAVRDTVTGLTRVTAFENSDSAATRAGAAYSSFHTQRTAVFKINVDGISNRLAGGQDAYQLLNAELTVNTVTGASNEVKENYRIVVLDTLITNATTGGSDGAVNLLSLYDLPQEFRVAGTSATLVTPYRVHSVTAALRNALRRPGGSRYIYVYIRPVSEHGVMLWDRSAVKLETVFTPSRSQ